MLMMKGVSDSSEVDLATGSVKIRGTSKIVRTTDQPLVMNVGYTLATGNAARAAGTGRKVARTIPP